MMTPTNGRVLFALQSRPKHSVIFHVQNTPYTTVYLDLLHHDVHMNS